MNLVCCICTELLNASADVYSTPCGHLFHNQCLHQWLVRSKSCPQCRFAFAERSIHKIYFNVGNTADVSFTEIGVIQQANDDLKLQLSEKTKQIKTLELKIDKDEQLRLKIKEKYHVAAEKNRSYQFLIETLREQLGLLESESSRYKGIQDELNKAKAKLEAVKLVQDVLDSTAQQVDEIITRETNVKTLAVLVATLKRELVTSESRRKEISSYLENVQDACRKKEDIVGALKTQNEILKNNNERLSAEINQLKTSSNENNSNESNRKPPDALENKRISIIRNNSSSSLDSSPPVHEKVRLIEEATSPYHRIRSSSVGLAPLLLRGPPRVLEGAHNSRFANIEIFKQPRLSMNITSSGNGSNVLNGHGNFGRRVLNMNMDLLPKSKNLKRPHTKKK